jgi:hypothetical protein
VIAAFNKIGRQSRRKHHDGAAGQQAKQMTLRRS